MTYRDGKLFWNRFSRGRRMGKPIGRADGHGYLQFQLEGRVKKVHRVIWEMFNGPIPDGMVIDHINRDRTDNRVDNLRLVTRQENSFNTNAKGAYPHGNKFISKIHKDGKEIYLGLFTSETEAREAYLKAKQELHKIGENQ